MNWNPFKILWAKDKFDLRILFFRRTASSLMRLGINYQKIEKKMTKDFFHRLYCLSVCLSVCFVGGKDSVFQTEYDKAIDYLSRYLHTILKSALFKKMTWDAKKKTIPNDMGDGKKFQRTSGL